MATEAKIESIFYARFHDEHGPRVFHQVPEGSLIPSPSPTSIKVPFFDFQALSTYIIPNREFCNRPLSVCSNGYRILGHPVCITDSTKYERNDFIFNFCIVVDDKDDWTPLRSLVSKLARIFGNLEEQDSFLSRDEEGGAVLVAGSEGYGGEKGSKVFAVVEMVFEDLRTVGEAMIPIDESNTLQLCLFPTRKAPPTILNHHVPISVARFSSLQTSTWDLTIQMVIPHINGIHSVSRIAQLADTDISLTRRAIQHLVYYDCVLLLDIFSFSAIYAPTPAISTFISSPEMQDECRQYVYSRTSLFGKSGDEFRSGLSTPADAGKSRQDDDGLASDTHLPSRMQVINLYTSFRQSLSLRDFCLSRSAHLSNIDIRRFVTFGTIKGFLYRVHKYAVLPASSSFSQNANPGPDEQSKAHLDGAGIPVSLLDQMHGRGINNTSKAKKAIRTDSDQLESDLIESQEEHETTWRIAALSSGWRLPDGQSRDMALGIGGRRVSRMEEAVTPPDEEDQPWRGKVGGSREAEDASATTSAVKRKQDRDVLRYADGVTCFDAVCTEWKCVEQEVVERMRTAGDVVFVTR